MDILYAGNEQATLLLLLRKFNFHSDSSLLSQISLVVGEEMYSVPLTNSKTFSVINITQVRKVECFYLFFLLNLWLLIAQKYNFLGLGNQNLFFKAMVPIWSKYLYRIFIGQLSTSIRCPIMCLKPFSWSFEVRRGHLASFFHRCAMTSPYIFFAASLIVEVDFFDFLLKSFKLFKLIQNGFKIERFSCYIMNMCFQLRYSLVSETNK